MEMHTNLQVHECLARIERPFQSGSAAERLAACPKYCFGDGSPRIASEVNGLEFSLALFGVSEYGSIDQVGRLLGHVAQNPSGGSVIRGKFVWCIVHMVAMALLVILTAFPPALMMLLGRPMSSLGNGFALMWFGCMGAFLIAFLWGFIYSRRLLSGFLRDLLEAIPQQH